MFRFVNTDHVALHWLLKIRNLEVHLAEFYLQVNEMKGNTKTQTDVFYRMKTEAETVFDSIPVG